MSRWSRLDEREVRKAVVLSERGVPLESAIRFYKRRGRQ